MYGSHKGWKAGALAASLGLGMVLALGPASAQYRAHVYVPGVLQQLFEPGDDSILHPGEVAAIVRGYGYRQASRPYLRGSVYIVDATDRAGYRVRLVLSAYEGQVIDRAFIAGPGYFEPGERQAALPPREDPRDILRPRLPRAERRTIERQAPEQATPVPRARAARPPAAPSSRKTAAVPPPSAPRPQAAPSRPAEPSEHTVTRPVAPPAAPPPATAALPEPEERDLEARPSIKPGPPRAPETTPAPPRSAARPAQPGRPVTPERSVQPERPARPASPPERAATAPDERPAPRVVLPNPIERPGPPAPAAVEAPRRPAPTPDVPPAALE